MAVLETHLYEGGAGFLREVGSLKVVSESLPYAGKLKAAYDRKACLLSNLGGQDQCDIYASLGGTLVAPWPNPQGDTFQTLRPA